MTGKLAECVQVFEDLALLCVSIQHSKHFPAFVTAASFVFISLCWPVYTSFK